MRNFIFLLLLSSQIASAQNTALPQSVQQQIPIGYEVLQFQSGMLNNDNRVDYLVVLKSKKEQQLFDKTREGSKRPLLIFIQNKSGAFDLAKRNDNVVLTIADGGQCDPFDENNAGLVIKNHYFTVENAVSCGQHWIDYVTFRYDSKANDWLFHKEVIQSWRLNQSQDANADALVSNGITIKTAEKSGPTPFEKWSHGS